jgi:hypothetical protein
MRCGRGRCRSIWIGCQAGVLGFERGLTTEVIPEFTRRSTWVQVYAVPVMAVPTPGAVRKITGLAGSGSSPTRNWLPGGCAARPKQRSRLSVTTASARQSPQASLRVLIWTENSPHFLAAKAIRTNPRNCQQEVYL